MKEHEIKTVLVDEQTIFKGIDVKYEACYLYCDVADEFYMNEQQIQENDLRLKNTYRKTEGLLTSDEIIAIRAKYGITQSDLCLLLGWGGKTITRYESHQVQDKAHDSILKKLDDDPKWFIFLLNEAKNKISIKSYKKYFSKAVGLYEANKANANKKTIESDYAKCDCSLTKFTKEQNEELAKMDIQSEQIDIIRQFLRLDAYGKMLVKTLIERESLRCIEQGTEQDISNTMKFIDINS
ncbi:MAG: hypothetical protein IKW90_04660 [Lachnospiraceae bacterium]|nr:hypothetical protein [Lachnospiraceae bacterium]